MLLICVDDLKPVLGCYGDTHAKTPNLDRLAARSLRLDRAYCNQAVCSPSRNALLTGLRPQTLGIYELSTNFRKAKPDAVTVAQHFKAAVTAPRPSARSSMSDTATSMTRLRGACLFSARRRRNTSIP